MQTRINGRPIMIGYPWRQRLAWSSTQFPNGCQLSAHIRSARTDAAALATLSTQNGGLVIVSATELDVVVPASASGLFKPGSVVLDFVRTDLSPKEHLFLGMTVPVVLPVTRGL